MNKISRENQSRKSVYKINQENQRRESMNRRISIQKMNRENNSRKSVEKITQKNHYKIQSLKSLVKITY